MLPKDANGMANSVDPDLTAPFQEQSDLGLHCLVRPTALFQVKILGIF